MYPAETDNPTEDAPVTLGGIVAMSNEEYLMATAVRLNRVLDQIEEVLPALAEMSAKLSKNPLFGGLFK